MSIHIINGIEVTITRKRIKNIRLTVMPPDGRVSVSAPHRACEGEILDFVRSKAEWIDVHRRLILSDPPKTYSPEEILRMKARLEQTVPPLFAEWQAKMGVTAAGWHIRTMKTRWGSCSKQTRRICLNSRLGGKSVRCIEYVVAHEIAHLLQMNHSHKFYALLDKHMPDWRERRAELRS